MQEYVFIKNSIWVNSICTYSYNFQISNKKERYFINLLMMKMKMIGMDDVRIKEKQF